MFKLANACVLLTFASLITQVRAEETKCPELVSPEAIIQCALIRHPDIGVGDAHINESLKLERFARQFPNPEFDTRSTYGKYLGDDMANVELNLAFVLELGGKRRARIQKAWAEQAEATANLLKTKEDVYIGTLSTLIRLRQLSVEIEAMEHALEAFGSIQKLYKAYGQLSPEQQISLNIFQLAQGDYRAKKTAAILEQQRYFRGLKMALGQDVPNIKTIYPSALSNWPKLDFADDLNGSGMKLAEADLKSAEAEVKSAVGDTWPTVRIGPSIEQQTEGPFTYHTFGFNLSLPLPLFHFNQGGRAYANAGLMRSQANFKAQKTKLSAEKEILINQYNSLIDSLRQMPSVEAIEKKHVSAESYFRRGLLATSLMVEYHRQIVDFIMAQNELELGAMQSLWKVYALEGKIFKDSNK
jgi:cobalt-zinc-cadmium efflux system outer membrane protein